MRHRVFIAINLPEELKKKLLDFQNKWSDLPIRLVKRDNLHITLAFLGYISDEEIIDVCQAVKEVCSNFSPFTVSLDRIDYGIKESGIPRLIWIKGEASKELSLLKDGIDKSLTGLSSFPFDKKDLCPHITLGRIRKWEWKRIDPEEIPDISEDLSFTFEVESVEVMESRLKRGGAEYFILESCALEK